MSHGETRYTTTVKVCPWRWCESVLKKDLWIFAASRFHRPCRDVKRVSIVCNFCSAWRKSTQESERQIFHSCGNIDIEKCLHYLEDVIGPFHRHQAWIQFIKFVEPWHRFWRYQFSVFIAATINGAVTIKSSIAFARLNCFRCESNHLLTTQYLNKQRALFLKAYIFLKQRKYEVVYPNISPCSWSE